MAMDAIKFVHEQLTPAREFPSFRPGDNIVVNYKIIEGDKERIQAFRGDVIQIKGDGSTKTFTVRKVSNGVGVERIFPFASPNISEIQVLKRGQSPSCAPVLPARVAWQESAYQGKKIHQGIVKQPVGRLLCRTAPFTYTAQRKALFRGKLPSFRESPEKRFFIGLVARGHRGRKKGLFDPFMIPLATSLLYKLTYSLMSRTLWVYALPDIRIK